MKTTKKFLLPDQEIPTAWYNVLADMPPLQPMLNPATKEPVKPSDLEPLFAKGLIEQEFSTERWIPIPEEVRTLYKIYRPTPLVRASGLEKALDTPAHIYFKNESVSPVGSHKLNTALPQAYYNKIEGVKNLATETGAGQWGSALSIACSHFGLNTEVFMVRLSYDQKPYRKVVMQTYGAKVIPSPSNLTKAGQKFLAEKPHTNGSLGMAISEACERAVTTPDTRYTLGSVLNMVMLHQTIIGLEAERQFEMAGDYPDTIIGCFGGGSNFGGISLPFLRHQLAGKAGFDFIAAESSGCPKLTKGTFRYDHGDTAGMTPLIPMYTLGCEYEPAAIHAGGLRYHGAGAIMSQLLKDKIIRAVAIDQDECFKVGILFSRCEGIIPAPESTHAIAATVREALKAKEEGREKVILFNLSGHGLLDLSAYESFLNGKL
ncbi:MAG TPA: TrpB-like pyridoxal phosphate-dependent enzyme [Bacteroidales bacterium]|nr:TrpB-like pyridoxal phosphate-dependent enzyme [Bacteroidales bacterium]HOF75811.1 TrpB-like pyridoxal phosphate-dependent enzyme [Bacteroidales bacterium]HOQ96394.1 TrpB-like pyridoxal phosphate-dependent enzyme [Bacteroidales bacterium]HOT55238.1 TrpB-like pyridoxal phosphate-dependent enzyme [Bacteroidales bacterium]HPL84371.1 TrpB-like pyridoxal phosphate-dependent enzyme [Bacteroidales bacterium]